MTQINYVCYDPKGVQTALKEHVLSTMQAIIDRTPSKPFNSFGYTET